MQVYSAILLSVALYAQTSKGSKVEEMCAQFHGGELVNIPITSQRESEASFMGLSHTFCKVTFGASNASLWMDAGAEQSLTQPSIASTLYKTIPYVNFRTVMKNKPVGSVPVAAAMCTALGGSQVSDYQLDYGFIDDKGFNMFCVFGDGSFIDAWGLYYVSTSAISKDRDSAYVLAREQIPEEMMWPRFAYPVGNDFFIEPTEVKSCQQNSDCEGVVNPCQAAKGKPARMVCDTEQNICAVPKKATSCKTDADCVYESLTRSYAEDGLGYCLPQVCVGLPGERTCLDA